MIDLGTLRNFCFEEIQALAVKWLSPSHTLCPGIVKTAGEVKGDLGYIPKKLRVMGRSVHSSKCKKWHVPSAKPAKSSSWTDQRWNRVFGECLSSLSYLKARSLKKKNLAGVKRYQRQKPSSNYTWKYLSPVSKRRRRQNIRAQRTRLIK